MPVNTDQIANDLEKAYAPFYYQLGVLKKLSADEREEVIAKWISKHFTSFLGDKIEALVIAKLLHNILGSIQLGG